MHGLRLAVGAVALTCWVTACSSSQLEPEKVAGDREALVTSDALAAPADTAAKAAGNSAVLATGGSGASTAAVNAAAAAQVPTGTSLCYGAPGFQPLAPWPTVSLCPMHRSQSPVVAAQTATLAWSATLAGVVEDSAVVAADGTVYVATNQRVYALDATGHVKWSMITPLTSGATPALGSDGTVYIGTTAGIVNALNPANGSVRWSKLTLGVISSGIVIATDGTLYVSAQSGQLTALSPAGQTKWSLLRSPMYASPAIGADGTIYVSANDGLHAVNPTGSSRWDLSFGALVGSRSAPAIASDGTIYVGAENSKFYAVTSAGTIRWSVTTGGAVRSSAAIANDGTIYVGSRDKKVYAITPTGTVKWTRATTGNVDSSPALGADGTIYVGSDDKKLYALKPADGSVLFTLTTGGAVRGSPAIGRNGTVYVGSDDSKLYAVGPGSCQTSDPTCNGIDDNCNGLIDDGFVSQATNCGVGACRSTGTSTCANGVLTDSCVAKSPASTTDASCNGIDDNCNGQTDEGYVTTSTSCGVGACRSTGTTSCVAGAVKDSCKSGTPAASDTTCNAVDDNCNGQTDEGYTGTTSSCGVGACANTGTSTCSNGTVNNQCTPKAPLSANDLTCNGIDDNCNGQTDEGYVGTTSSCGVGACVNTGMSACVSGSVVPNCTPKAPLSATDTTCNSVDDNCNGQVDEGYVSTTTACGVGACANTGTAACVNGSVSGGCTPKSPLSATDATCDGVDDNCNGQVDENYAPQALSCGAGACAATGTTLCASGVVINNCGPGSPAPNDTTCDGIDDNCNGQVDEGYVPAQTSCTKSGCLAHGLATCSAGHTTDNCATSGVCYVETNCADGADNDSDGAKDCADSDCAGTTACSSSVPDPRSIAPVTDRTHFASTYELGQFLFSAADPIQIGVTPSAIPPERFGIARGRVLTTSGAPLRDVSVSVLNHPEFGSTVTRADGEYDLALNGGVQRQLVFTRTGYLTVQRPVKVNWDTFAALADVALTALDPTLGSVDLANTTHSQVVRGSVQTDQDGTRRPTLLFPVAIGAQMVMPNGSVQPLSHMSVHVTEFSVGGLDPGAMPAQLPPRANFAYGASFDVEEAMSAGAKSVQFSTPVPVYLENFTALAVGTGISIRTYDPIAGVWQTSPAGRVVKILSITAGKADVDTKGTGVADDAARLAALGITDDERTNLATLYAPGASLWRVPFNHFSTVLWGPCPGRPPPPPDPTVQYFCIIPDPVPDSDDPDDGSDYPPHVVDPDDLASLYGQDVPDQSGQGGGDPLDTPVVPSGNDSSDEAPDAPIDDPCSSSGASSIEVENGTLREDVPIAGTPFTLNYSSNRTQAAVSRGLEFTVPVSTGSPRKPGFLGTRVSIDVGGRLLTQFLAADSTQQTVTIAWDGLNAYGRAMVGATRAVIRTCYVYNGSRLPISLCSSYVEHVTPYLSTAFGPDGWMLSAQHVYDTTGRVLTVGNGQQVSATGRALGYTIKDAYSHTAGWENGNTDLNGIGNTGFVQLADGSVIAMGPNPQGANPIPYLVVAKNTYSGDVDAFFADTTTWFRNQTWLTPVTVFAGPNGTIYTHERANGPNSTVRDEVRRYSLDANNHLVQLGAVVATNVNPIASGPDGSLYAWGTPGQLMQYTADGVGTPLHQSPNVDSAGKNTVTIKGSAPGSLTWVSWLVSVGADATVYVVEQWSGAAGVLFGSLYALPSSGGVIPLLNNAEYEAGNPDTNPNDGVGVTALTVDPTTNRVAMGVGLRARIVQVIPGRVLTLVGENFGAIPGFGEPLKLPANQLWYVQNMSYGPDGLLYFSQRFGAARVSAIRRVEPNYPSDDLVPLGSLQLPSPDGQDIYVFDSGGRQIETRDANSGDLVYSFGYTQGWLTSITDRFGGQTRIMRDASGNVQQIVAPFGQTTNIMLDGAGQIARVTAPDTTEYAFTYDPSGMLATLKNPRGYTSHYTFDDEGKLTAESDAAGGGKTLARTGSAPTNVGMTTAENVQSGFEFERGTNGLTRVVTFGDGSQNRVSQTPAGSELLTLADGTTVTTKRSPDPLWGMMAPFTSQSTTVYPSGRTSQTTVTRSVTPLDPSKPFGPANRTQTLVTNGLTTTLSYAASTRTLTVTSPQGRVTTSSLDAAGTHRQITRPGRATEKTTLDAKGRPISVTLDDGTTQRTTTFGYDAASGYMNSSVGPIAGATQSFANDSFGRALSQQSADGSQTGFVFDENGNQRSETPPGRSAHQLVRSPVDLVSSYRAPDLAGGTTPVPQLDYTYTLDRNTKRVLSADGQDIEYTYADGGQLALIMTGRGNDQYRYEAPSGKLASILSDDGRELIFSYDGDVTTSVSWAGTAEHVNGDVSMVYDANSRLSSLQVNGAPVANFTRDNDGLLKTSGPLQITREPISGDITATQLGNLTTMQGVNRFGELTSSSAAYNASTLYAEQVSQRDLAGRIVDRTETVQGTTHAYHYGYDPVGRLTDVNLDTAPLAHYAYDANGNRTSLAANSGTRLGAYDAQDRLTMFGPYTYGYSAVGALNLKTDTRNGAATTYDYDGFGNLRRVQLPDGRDVHYEIDARNRRVGKSIDGVRSFGLLYVDQLSPVALLAPDNSVVATFVYGTQPNVPDYMTKNGNTYRFIVDHLGSVRMVVNTADGSVAQRIDYDEFGNVTSDSNRGFQPFGFAGGIYDPDTGLVRFGTRDYDATTGRWTAKDSILFGGGVSNLYQYAHGDPVNRIDPTGLDDIPWCGPEGPGIYSDSCVYMSCLHGDGSMTEPSTYAAYSSENLRQDAAALASDVLVAAEYVWDVMSGGADTVDRWISDEVTSPAKKWGDALKRNREINDDAVPRVCRTPSGASPPPID